MAQPSALKRALELARQGGVSALWFTALGKLCYRRVEIREHLLDKPENHRLDAAEFSIDQLTSAEFEEYNEFRSPSDPESAPRRMQAGHRCFIVRHKGKIVCASWAATSNATSAYLSAPIPLTADEVYAYDLFTAPDWRRKGIGAAVMSVLHEFYRAQGKRRVLSYVVPENYPSAAGSLGDAPIGKTGVLGIGRFRLTFFRMDEGKLAPGEPRRGDTQQQR